MQKQDDATRQDEHQNSLTADKCLESQEIRTRINLALTLLDSGLRPLLLESRSKKPGIRYKQFKGNSPPTQSEIERWPWRPDSNMAILTGLFDPVLDHQTGLYHAVLDFEVNQHPLINELLTMDCIPVKTNRGFHFHFVTKNPIRSFQVKSNSNVVWEILGVQPNKVALVPPSIHPDTGKQYEYCADTTLLDLFGCKPMDITDFPEEIQTEIMRRNERDEARVSTAEKESKLTKVKHVKPLIEPDTMKMIARRAPCIRKLTHSMIRFGERNTVLRFIFARLQETHTSEYARKYLEFVYDRCCEKRPPMTSDELDDICNAEKWHIGCSRGRRDLDLWSCCTSCQRMKSQESWFLTMQRAVAEHNLSGSAVRVLFRFPDLEMLRSDCPLTGSQREIARITGMSPTTVNHVLRELRSITELMDLAHRLENGKRRTN